MEDQAFPEVVSTKSRSVTPEEIEVWAKRVAAIEVQLEAMERAYAGVRTHMEQRMNIMRQSCTLRALEMCQRYNGVTS